MPPKPLDQKLYKRVKKQADLKFTHPTSAYKSMWIVREYKKQGGKYSRSSSKKTSGLSRWLKEKWVNLKKPIYDSKGNVKGYKPCGRSSAKELVDTRGRGYPLCRPTVRVTSDTPRTVSELSSSTIKRLTGQKKSSKRVSFKSKRKRV